MTAKWRSALLIRLVCLGSALLWISLVAADRGLLERFELAALDTELSLAPAPRASPEIVIIAVDEGAVHRYGPLVWPPEQMATVVTALDHLGARLIAFDFVFTGEANRYGQTRAQISERHERLRKAIERSGRVVLGTYFDFEAEPEQPAAFQKPDLRDRRVRQIRYSGGTARRAGELPPAPKASGAHAALPELTRAARAYGHLNLIPSRDGIIRWMPLVARLGDDLYTAFSVEVACAYLSEVKGDARAGAREEVRPEVFAGKQRVEGLRLGNRRVTTDEHGRLLVRFAGPRASYATFSAADLLDGQIPAERIRNRIVLVGSTAAGAADVWATPRDPLLPGVEIHANAIDNLLQGNFLVRNWLTRLLTFAVLALLGLVGAVVLPGAYTFGLRRVSVLTGTCVGLLIVGHYLFFTRTGYAVDLVSPLLATAMLLGGTLSVNYFMEEKQRKQVERCFAHYLDRKVIAQLLESPERLRLGGERRELTVLFCDIRNFTTLAEGFPPEVTVEMLNEFFTTMTDVVFANGGLVDKFVGDQIMAFWGAPLETEDHAEKACLAALGMMQEFGRMRERWARSSAGADSRGPAMPATINCGIGINSGTMVVGNIGSSNRFSYTVIGDQVNVAARLEALNKLYGTQILVGPSTYALVRGLFRFREIDFVRVRGRNQALTVCELLGPGNAPDIDSAWLTEFAEGLAAYRRNDWERAERAFTATLARNPADACAKYYLSLVEQFAQNSLSERGEGVVPLR